MLDAKGRPRGLEVDLAQALADHLRVSLRLVTVSGEERLAGLQAGTIDLLIAGIGDTPARRQEAASVEPHYYGSGVNVLLRPEPDVSQWSQLRGHTLCAVEGAAFNDWLTQRHHARLHAAPSVAEALQALAHGRCSGLLYTEAAVQHLRRLPDWRHYRMPLDSALVVPWAIRLARSEQGGELEREVGNALARWHREGALIALEKKWGLKPSGFLQQARDRWSVRRVDGSWVCTRDTRGRWPSSCRDAAFVDSQQAQGLLRLAMGLRDRWGIRLAPPGEAYDGGRYLQSLALTGLLAGAALSGAGLLVARGWRWLQAWRRDHPSLHRFARLAVHRVMRLLRKGGSPAVTRSAPQPSPMWALLARLS
jgi:polar amino acid transport system substrate-binding protein